MHLTTDNTAQCGTFSLSISARSDRYHHLETKDEEDDTNDEDFNVEMRQFSSSSHRFSKVSCVSLFFPHSLIHVVQNCSDEKSPDPSVCSKKKWQTMASTVSAIELSSKIYTHLLFLEGYAFVGQGTSHTTNTHAYPCSQACKALVHCSISCFQNLMMAVLYKYML